MQLKFAFLVFLMVIAASVWAVDTPFFPETDRTVFATTSLDDAPIETVAHKIDDVALNILDAFSDNSDDLEEFAQISSEIWNVLHVALGQPLYLPASSQEALPSLVLKPPIQA